MGENATSTTVAEPSEQELEKEVKKASEQNRRYIRPSELVAFLLTTFGQKNLDQFVNAYRQFFMISFLGISGRAYGLIVFIESIYDAVDDSLSGLIIDRTRTRWGRLRPYMIITVPIWGLATLMLFTTPQFLSGNTSNSGSSSPAAVVKSAWFAARDAFPPSSSNAAVGFRCVRR